MAVLNVSLPDDLSDWLASRVAADGYGTPSDYVRDLVLRAHNEDDEDAALERLRAAIDEGRASGVSTRSLEDILADGLKRHREG